MRRFRRIAAWTLSCLLALVAAIILLFWLTPWPSALLIVHTFAGNDRQAMAALEKHVPAGVETLTDIAYGDVAAERMDIFRPEQAITPLPVVLWVHGGAWIGGSKDGVANYLKILAAPGYVTVGIDYSTAPGANYPTPTRQANKALAYLTKHADKYAIDPKRVFLAGDSAGAQIAGQMANLVTNSSYAAKVGIAPAVDPDALKGVILVSGAFDIPSVRTDGGLQNWFVNTVLWAYSGIRNFRDDQEFLLASVTPNISANFPATFIASGDADPLEPQARTLADRLAQLNVPVETQFFDADKGLGHEFQFNLDDSAGNDVLQAMLRFLDERSGSDR